MAIQIYPTQGIESGLNALTQGLQSRAAQQRQNLLAQYLPDAIKGDQGALQGVAQIDPNAYLQIQNQVSQRQQQGAQQAQKFTMDTLDQLEKTTSGALVNSANPEADYPQIRAYALSRAAGNPQLQQLIGQALPERYDPSLLTLAKGALGLKPEVDPLQQKMGSLRAAGIDPNSPEGRKYLGTYVDPNAGQTSITFGGLSSALDAQGNPVFIQPSNRGGASAIPGFRPFTADAAAQEDLARAKAQGAVTGKLQGEAQANLPSAIQTGQYALDVIDQLANAPGRSTITGASGAFGIAAAIPGTDAANAKALLDQINGRAFLEAFGALRGGGAITEIEGQKATQAIARLQTSQSDKAFEASLKELRGIISKGLDRAKQQAGTQNLPAEAPAQTRRLKYNPATGKVE